jgi:hypothetical protein
MYRIIDQTAAAIREGRERNFQYWPVIGKWVYYNITPVAQSYEEEVQRMKDWIKSRLAWLDKNIPGFCNSVGTEEKDPLISAVNAYPNPFREGFSLNYYLRENSDISIELLNAAGMKVQQIFQGNQFSGMHTVRISSQDLSDGMYIVLLRTDDKIYRHKMIKNR